MNPSLAIHLLRSYHCDAHTELTIMSKLPLAACVGSSAAATVKNMMKLFSALYSRIYQQRHLTITVDAYGISTDRINLFIKSLGVALNKSTTITINVFTEAPFKVYSSAINWFNQQKNSGSSDVIIVHNCAARDYYEYDTQHITTCINGLSTAVRNGYQYVRDYVEQTQPFRWRYPPYDDDDVVMIDSEQCAVGNDRAMICTPCASLYASSSSKSLPIPCTAGNHPSCIHHTSVYLTDWSYSLDTPLWQAQVIVDAHCFKCYNNNIQRS